MADSKETIFLQSKSDIYIPDAVTIPVIKPDNIYTVVFTRGAPETKPKELVIITGGLIAYTELFATTAEMSFPTAGAEAFAALTLLAMEGYEIEQIKVQTTQDLLFTGKFAQVSCFKEVTHKSFAYSEFMNERNYQNNILTMPIKATVNSNNTFIFDISDLLKNDTFTLTFRVKNAKVFGQNL
jgi:hypothetical protein